MASMVNRSEGFNVLRESSSYVLTAKAAVAKVWDSAKPNLPAGELRVFRMDDSERVRMADARRRCHCNTGATVLSNPTEKCHVVESIKVSPSL